MSTNKPCRTILLTDAPAAEDAFGSHKRIVSAIAEILENEHGGKTIGIEGVWGSGKSTVVNLLRDQLKKSTKTVVITFDAWMHEGDPLRRSFLERIVMSFLERQWIDGSKWRAYLASLAHRQSTRKQRTTPKLTGQGVAIAIALLAMPAGLVIFSRGFAFMGNPAVNPDFLLWLGGAIVASPLILAILFLLCGWSKGRKGDDLFRVLANKVITEEKTVTTEDPEPTSIEFTKQFFAIMAEALSHTDRRVVLIVDNLDRVPGSYARQIWAALRTFLEHSDSGRPAWFERLWIVVPYAHQSLAIESKESDGEQDKLAPFIDKVFQIRFYLSSPVLSDWKEYLLRELKIAFPDHADEEDEFQKIFNVINLRRTDKKSPTPREVVLFINDIGALHRQWQHEFKLSHMAYYAHLRREEIDILPALESGQIPNQAELEFLGSELPYNTAALYFNRDVETARQILLKAPLEKSLGEGNRASFLDLSKKHSKMFPVLQNSLRSMLDGWIPVPNQDKVALAADCLLDPGVLTGASEAEERSIKENLVWAAMKVDRWSGIDAKVSSGLSKLVAFDRNEGLVKKVQDSLFRSYPFASEDRKAEMDPARQKSLEAYVSFLKVLKSLDLLKSLADIQLIPGKAHDWILAVAYFSDADPKRDVSADVNLNVDPQLFSNELVAAVSTGEVSELHVSALRLALQKASIPLAQVATAIQARFAAMPDLPGPEIVSLVIVLQIGRNNPSSTVSVLSQLSNGGQFFHHISNAFGRNDFKAAAYLTVAVLDSRPEITSNAYGKSQDGINQLVAAGTNPGGYSPFVQAFTELFLVDSDLTNFAFLYGLWVRAPRIRNLVKAVLLALGKQGRLQGRLAVQQLLAIWQELDTDDRNAQKDPLALIEVLKAIDKEGEFTKQLATLAVDASNARLYIAVLLSQDGNKPEFVEHLGKSLGAIDKNTWMNELQSKGQLGTLVRLLHSRKAGIVLRDPFLDAVVDYAVKIMKGNVTNAYPSAEWTAMLETLHPSLRVRFKEILLDAALDVRGAVNDQLFDVFGQELLDIEVLANRDDLVPKLFMPLVENKNAKGLIWIASVVTANNGGLENFRNDHAINELRMRLTTALHDSKGSSTERYIQQIVDAWKVSGPEVPKADAPAETPK